MEVQLRPMLCSSADVVPEGEKWQLEGKLDGWRTICVVSDPNEHVQMFGGRNGSSYSGKVPYIDQALADSLPPGTVVDGELIGNGGWGTVQGVMTRGDGGHVPSEAIPALTYVVFDVLRYDGKDLRSLPLVDRRAVLTRIDWQGENIITSPAGESTAAAHQQMLDLGLEGTVSKRIDSRYVHGRSNLWVKVKPQDTAEAKVIGFKPGTKGSEFEGLVGALELEMLDTGAKTRASGFDMATRKQITENPDEWLGTVVEIKHHGIGTSGKPRHPQYLRRRDDRNPAPAPKKRAKTTGGSMPTTTGATGRMRNYGAMKDEKLLRCISELEAGSGDAHERALTGSGDPAADLAAAKGVARERGL